MKILFPLLLILSLKSFGQVGEEQLSAEKYARDVIKEISNNESYKPFSDTLIPDKQTAMAVAEPILFKFYGKALVSSEKPYKCYLVDGYWYVHGSLPKGAVGGVFEIFISAKDGRIIRLTHGK